MRIFNRFSVVVLAVLFVIGLARPSTASAFSNPSAVNLLTVDNFAALAKTSISSPTGPTTLNNGDLGIDSPGVCTNFIAPCTGPINGTINNGVIQFQNAVALQGQTDSTAVVGDLNGRTANQTIAGGLLDGLTLNQGVYDVPAAVTNLTGDLTLSGDADSIFIFRMPSTLVTAGTSRVLLTGGAQACNVFWTSGSSNTFNGTSQIVGTFFASASNSFPGGGATLNGRVIAQTAAITFNNTTVNNSSCATLASASASSGSSNNGDHVEIKVNKKADPADLAGPGLVTFTFKVTNEGDVPIRNVEVVDDRCSPLVFVKGDTDDDHRLDPNEEWRYTCTRRVSQSETDRVTARGEAGGRDVSDSDTARVEVLHPGLASPGFPNTGVSSDEEGGSTSWNIIAVVAGIFAASAAVLIVARKKQTI